MIMRGSGTGEVVEQYRLKDDFAFRSRLFFPTSLFLFYLVCSLLPLPIVRAEEPAKEQPAVTSTEKAAEAPPKAESKKQQIDETIQFLKERLRSMEASAEIAANLKEDDKTMALRFYRGKTAINLEFDPMASDVFFDITINGLFTPTGADAGGREPSPGKGAGKAQSAREAEAEAAREQLANKLKNMLETMEDKAGPQSPEGTKGSAKGVNPEVLSHIYQAQKAYYAKNYKTALKAVEKSLELDETALALALKGTIHIATGERSDAIKAWRRALELDPAMSDVEEALKYYESREKKP